MLTDDGVIFASIDENEVANLRKVLDDIFGEINCAGEIIWKNSSKNDQAYISIQHEYILVYCKNKIANSGEWYEPKEGVEEIQAAFSEFRKKYGDDWDAIHSAAQEWYKSFRKIVRCIQISIIRGWMKKEYTLLLIFQGHILVNTDMM